MAVRDDELREKLIEFLGTNGFTREEVEKAVVKITTSKSASRNEPLGEPQLDNRP